MSNAFFNVPSPKNEPVRQYAPNSPERESLLARVKEMAAEHYEIPLIIGGKEIFTGDTDQCIMPHKHQHVLATYHRASESHVELAIKEARRAWLKWSEMPWQDRAAIFLKMADLLAGPYRDTLNAATMLGQSKTVFQAEIDSACELIDFFRFNVKFMADIYSDQPESSAGMWNRSEYRALEGFIFAITPFNFTSIAGNLPTAPALMGNVALWKPSHTAVYSGYFLMKLFKEAGLPDGVINFVPGPSPKVAKVAIESPDFAGIHFTGSTGVFQKIWNTIGNNISNYKSYPRIVGETGGKDFIFAHETADPEAVAVAILRGGFEFQGQKCSAASRVYLPTNLWGAVKKKLIADLETVKVGDVTDLGNFMGAVIDDRAFNKISGYIQHAKDSDDAEIIFGGNCNDEVGYFIEPTVILTTNPKFKTMVDEIFGPVVTIYLYDPENLEEALTLCDETSPYALTGAIFSKDRYVIGDMVKKLRHAAGNFYINDKPTGAVVGQQPFGGGRASGTNDKAGSALNLTKWINARTIKETFVPPTNYRYPYMD
ncbi:MAG: 1-pyrroline-5-carboxylate dehydrogenase [Acidobacteria bacterium]|nr:MAG: 1-pyrroline-5-carboxylate dehydrogenase [Acidobacteriota bacterium]